MSRYIDVNKICLTALSSADGNGEVYVSLSDVRRALAMTPTVEIPFTERDIPKPRVQTRCGVCDLWLNECDWGDEDWCLSDSLRENYKYCPRCGQRIDWDHDVIYDKEKGNEVYCNEDNGLE